MSNHGDANANQSIELDDSEEERLLEGHSDDDSDEENSDVDDSEQDDLDDDDDDAMEGIEQNGGGGGDAPSAEQQQRYNDLVAAADTQKTYDAYVAVIDMAYELDDLAKIRESHNKMHADYPLSAEIWLKLIYMELSQEGLGDQELAHINALFKQSLGDYYCMEIAAQYSEFALSFGSESDWYNLTASYGYDILRGSDIMKNRRSHLRSVGGNNPETNLVILQTYMEQLKVPHHDIDATYAELCELHENHRSPVVDDIVAKCNMLYHTSKEILAHVQQCEQQLTEIPATHHHKRAEAYLKYIDSVKSKLNYRALQGLYERLVAACCLDASSWMKYVTYLMYRDPVACPIVAGSAVFGQSVMDVLNRACRNCPFSHELQVKRLRHAHHLGLDAAIVSEYTRNALDVTSQTGKGHLTAWLEHIAYVKRNESDPDAIRALFQEAADSLEQCSGDPYSELARFAADMEYQQFKNPDNGSAWYEKAMNNANNRNRASLWLEFAQCQLAADVQKARGVYERAAKVRSIDDFEAVQAAWKRYESIHGNANDIATCLSKLDKIVEAYERKMMLQKIRERNAANVDTEQDSGKGFKRKAQSTDTENATEKKKQKTQPIAAAGEAKQENQNHKQQKQQRQPQQQNQQQKQHQEPPKSRSEQRKPADANNVDDISVFISNLPYTVTEEEIVTAFPELNIKNISMKEKAGKPCGFAYMELSSEEEVTLALSFDRRQINGRPAFITRIMRDKSVRSDKAQVRNQKRIFLKGLPSDADADELRLKFDRFGTITDVTLIKRAGQPFTGLAYVDFDTNEAATDAIKATRSFNLRGHSVTVKAFEASIRDEIKAALTGQAGAAEQPEVAGAHRTVRGEARPRLSFIPSVVRQQAMSRVPVKPAESQASTTESKPQATTAKNNDFFRQFLKK